MYCLNTKNTLRNITLLAVFASLTACGFHLRGNIPLSEGLKNMFLVAPEGTFKDQLEDVLGKAGAELAANQAGADVVLNVVRADSERKVGTLDERGKVSSYNLEFNVHYSLVDPEGEVIRKLTKLRESRRYDFNPEQVLESESEEAELLSSMEQDIALRMVRQLSSITDYQPK
jgi:LPS-assembly lipoprotein